MDINSPEAAEWSDHMRRISALENENAVLREALRLAKNDMGEAIKHIDAELKE